MKKVIITKGLVASGKTTWAKEMLKKHPGEYKNICKDDLRLMFDDSAWSKSNEKFVLKMRNIMIISALKNNYSVIISDTNLAPKHEKEIRDLVEKYKDDVGEVEVEVKFFDVPPKECIKRDLVRPNSVGSKVIMDMYNKYLSGKPKRDVYAPDENLPKVVISDIDGTLATMNGRSPFDWHRVGEDFVNEKLRDILFNYQGNVDKIILFSGRDSVCRKETEKWLELNNIMYDELYMRPEGNNESDVIIKECMFNDIIRDKYQVEAIFDDRLRVCRLWNELGLPLFRVGDPDADF